MEVSSQHGDGDRGGKGPIVDMAKYEGHRSMEDIVSGLQRPTYSRESKSYPRYTRTSFNLAALLDLSKPPFRQSTPAEVKAITERLGQPTKASIEHAEATPDRNIKSRLQVEQQKTKPNSPRKGDHESKKNSSGSKKSEDNLDDGDEPNVAEEVDE